MPASFRRASGALVWPVWLAISTFVPRAGAQRPGPVPWTEISITSAKLGADRKIFVVTPVGYDSTSRVPVLVLLDANDRPQFEAAIANVRFLESRRAILPTLIVGIPNGPNRSYDLTPPSTDPKIKATPNAAGGADRFADFISDEVLPAVRARYHTLPFTVLAGHSYGGLFVVHVAATRPGAFPAAIAMSPSLWYNDSSSVVPYADAIARGSAPFRLFVTSGAFEPPIDITAQKFVARLDSLKPLRVAYRYRRYTDDSHGLTPLPSLTDGLRFIFEPISLAATRFDLLSASADSATILGAFRQIESSYASGARTIGIEPTMPEAFVRQTGLNVLNYFHKPRAATLILRENVDHFPQSAPAFDNLGDALLAAGDTAGARAQYRTAVTLATRAHDNVLGAVTDKLKKLEPNP